MEQELRVLHAEVIAKTRRHVSFSKFLSYLIQDILLEKGKQQWYGDHGCCMSELEI